MHPDVADRHHGGGQAPRYRLAYRDRARRPGLRHNEDLKLMPEEGDVCADPRARARQQVIRPRPAEHLIIDEL